jgi:hypothetical protein
MATNFPQYLATPYAIPPELQAQLDEIQKRRAAPVAPTYTPEQIAQRRGDNEKQYALGILGGLAADDGLRSQGGQVLKQALANRQAKTTERGTIDPITGQFTYSPDFLAQRDETTEGNIQNRIAQGRLNWDSQQQAQQARADQMRENALNRAANRPTEALVAVLDPLTGKSKLVHRADAVGMQPAPTGGGTPGEDERKAGGWVSQASLAFNQMRAAVADDAKAAKPSTKETLMGAIPGKLGETATYAAMSPARQRFTSAASSFSEAALRAATGAGVNKEEAIQKINELTPRWGESAAAIADKEARMQMYLGALETRAGRALPQATAALPQGAPGGTARNPMGAARNPAKPAGGAINFADLPP